MESKLRVVRMSERISAKNHCITHDYWLSDGSGPHGSEALARYVDMGWDTLKSRMAAYGHGSWLVFYDGRIPFELSKSARANRVLMVIEKPDDKEDDPVPTELPDGSIMTRDGKIISVGTFEKSFSEKRHVRSDRKEKPKKKGRSIYMSKKLLQQFNAQMCRKGFLRPSEFDNIAVMSL